MLFLSRIIAKVLEDNKLPGAICSLTCGGADRSFRNTGLGIETGAKKERVVCVSVCLKGICDIEETIFSKAGVFKLNIK